MDGAWFFPAIVECRIKAETNDWVSVISGDKRHFLKTARSVKHCIFLMQLMRFITIFSKNFKAD